MKLIDKKKTDFEEKEKIKGNAKYTQLTMQTFFFKIIFPISYKNKIFWK